MKEKNKMFYAVIVRIFKNHARDTFEEIKIKEFFEKSNAIVFALEEEERMKDEKKIYEITVCNNFEMKTKYEILITLL